MSLDIVYGESRSTTINEDLVTTLESCISEGTLYLGYPVLSSADSRVQVDALLVSASAGVIAFQFAAEAPDGPDAWAEVTEEQDRLFAVINGHLERHDALRNRRRLAFTPETVTLMPVKADKPNDAEGQYMEVRELPAFIETLDGLSENLYTYVRSALERVTNIKPLKKRSGITRQDSRGAVIREIEKNIANLDRWQKKAAIETPDGPQRIRGLAGSGKTIVLALKAAYLHAQHPEWQIAITYYSRALFQQMESLVTRFAYEHSYEPPDPDHLQILHSWGGSGRNGLYARMAQSIGAPVRDFAYARATYGWDDAFRGICQELLNFTERIEVTPLFDAVLIDEAQDLPAEFFQLVYKFTKSPKRVVWAYDELQRLSESAMPSTEELFGASPQGESLVNIENQAGAARRDIVLEVCYRNTPWTLATAHALGFGIYRPDGLIQHFDDYDLWTQIGYEPVHGKVAPGEQVTLRRSARSSPDFFERLISKSEAVQLEEFKSDDAQDEWVATEIARNLSEDELEHDDILVVIPDSYTAKRRASRIALALARHGIAAHNVGVNTAAEDVFVAGSVAITHIYRAKGNEAPMVYVVDAQFGTQGSSLVSNRNVLFTAITRSRAWVRITGVGKSMALIAEEIRKVREKDFELTFTLPSGPELALLRRIHKEKSKVGKRSASRAAENVVEALEQLDRGEIDLADLPDSLRKRLLEKLSD